MKPISVLLLAVAVLLAGCTTLQPPTSDNGDGDVEVTASDGLSVTFQPVSGSVAEGEDVRLRMNLRNTGQAEATGVSAGITGTGLVTDSDRIQDADSPLRAADPGSGEPGGETTAIWSGRNTLDLDEGESQDVRVVGVASYDYSTMARGGFNVVPQDEVGGSTSPVALDNTAAPVHASVDLTTPRPIYDDETRNVFSVPVTIRNVGDGEPSTVSFSAALPNVDDRVSLEGCAGSSSFPVDVELFESGERTISCTIDMTPLTGGLRFESTVQLQIDMSYTYTERDEVTVTATGRPGDQTGGGG